MLDAMTGRLHGQNLHVEAHNLRITLAIGIAWGKRSLPEFGMKSSNQAIQGIAHPRHASCRSHESRRGSQSPDR